MLRDFLMSIALIGFTIIDLAWLVGLKPLPGGYYNKTLVSPKVM